MAKEKKYILSSDIVNRKLSRLALEIIEGNMGEKELVFVGIESTGVILAKTAATTGGGSICFKGRAPNNVDE